MYGVSKITIQPSLMMISVQDAEFSAGSLARYLHIFYAGQLVQEFLYFSRIDVFSAADNHVLDASCDAVISLLILYT